MKQTVEHSSPHERTGQQDFMRHSILLTLVLGGANLANVVFQMAMGRMLSAVDYGVLMTMWGVLYILNVPADTLRTSMAYFAARYEEGADGPGRVAGLFGMVTRNLSVLMVPLLLLVVGASPWIRRYFRMTGHGPVLGVAVACLLQLLLTTLQGILQGTQRFRWYSISMVLWFVGRLFFAVLLVAAGFQATGCLLGMALGSLVGALGPYLFLRQSVFAGAIHPAANVRRDVRHYVGWSMLVYTGMMVVFNVDMLAVKHWFDPEEAGAFARATLLAHFLWLIPFPIVMAMFPKVVKERINGMNASLLRKTLIISAVVLVLSWAVVSIRPGWLFDLLFRERDARMIALMPMYAGAMIPLGIVFVMANYDMAHTRFGQVFLLLGYAAVLWGGLTFLHKSLEQVVFILLVGNVGLMICSMFCSWVQRGGPGDSKELKRENPQVSSQDLREQES